MSEFNMAHACEVLGLPAPRHQPQSDGGRRIIENAAHQVYDSVADFAEELKDCPTLTHARFMRDVLEQLRKTICQMEYRAQDVIDHLADEQERKQA
jgi:hypothetical protein